MVLHLPLHDWAARLAELRRQAGEVREERVWRLEIRIRILRYLLTRYGGIEIDEEAPDRITSGGTASDRHEGDLVPARASERDCEPVARPSVYPFRGVDYPPRPRESIAPILDDLARRNRVSRITRGADPAPEEVWSWWRSTWCAPQAPRSRRRPNVR